MLKYDKNPRGCTFCGETAVCQTEPLSDNETVEDIVSMLRRFANGEELPTDEMPSFTSLADRIEVAHRREVAELRECVQQAYVDVCLKCVRNGRNIVCSKERECERVKRWRNALEKTSVIKSEVAK